RGGTWTGGEISNPTDPDTGTGDKRHFYFSSPNPSGIPGLVEDIVSECRLKANINSSCPWKSGMTYTWSASNGGNIVSGQGTDTITTNGTGSYQVTITLSTGCAEVANFSYPAGLMMMKVITTTPGVTTK